MCLISCVAAPRGPHIFIVEIEAGRQAGVGGAFLRALARLIERRCALKACWSICFLSLVGLDHPHVARVVADVSGCEVAVVERLHLAGGGARTSGRRAASVAGL